MWLQQQEQAYLRGMPSQHPQQQTLHPGIVGSDDHMQQHHHHHHHHHLHHRSTTMDLPLPSNPRASRNMAEKQRRDNLNTNISAMATLVPTIAESPRKMDKISILRLAAAFLRMQYTLGRGTSDFLPRELGDLDLEQYIVDNLIENGGFVIVVTTTGKIVYVSRKVEQHLGHARTELLGQSLYTFVHPDDREELTKNITPDEMQATIPQITEVTNDNSNSSEDSTSLRNENKPFREQRRSFELRMLQRTVSRREHTQYECLQVSGILRLADACRSSEANGSRTRHREVSTTSNDIVFVAVARLLKKRPITELSIIDANKDEYVTRHLVDGRIIYCDQRVSVVTGYLSEEVSGLSAFSFMHKDDFRWPMIGLRQMYDRAETCGSSCYRLLSKTGEFIYLRTHGYLEFDKSTQTVESFLCINTLVSEDEGVELVKEMKKKFSATVSETARAMIQSGEEMSFDLDSDSQLSNSKSSLEDPSQLENAVTHLISDLPSPAVSEERLSPSPMPDVQFAKAAIVSQRLPPASAQASKIGIKKIDHYLVLQGKGNRTPKHEGKVESNKQSPSGVGSKIENSSVIEHHSSNDSQVIARNRLSGQENLRSPGKSMTIHEIPNQTQDGAQKETFPEQVNMLSVSDSTVETRMNVSHNPGTSRLDGPRTNTNILNTSAVVKQAIKDVPSARAMQENNTCKVKIEHAIDILKHLEKQEPVMEYLENGVIENGIASDSESNNQYSLKRICSDEDIHTPCNKKRHSNVRYVQSEANDEQQGVSYVNCRSYVKDEEFSGISSEFSQYSNINSQSIKVMASPNSSLNEVSADYQQLDPNVPLVISNMDDEQFVDLHDFKNDPLLSPGLDPNPDLIMKIFDDLRTGTSFDKTFNDTKVQQLADNNAIDNEIRRKYLQLANSMALRESQLNVLARDLENPALQAQRENFTQLQAEHNMQKQILQTLQQDHHNMQINIKHNIGV